MRPLSLLNILLAELKNKPKNVTAHWNKISKVDPYLRNVTYTADLIFGNGEKYRIASEPITVIGKNNEIISYRAAMTDDPSCSVSYDYRGGSASLRTINLGIDARGINPMEIILGGNTLAGVGEIALQSDGAEYEDRYVLIRGEMSGGITFGANQEVLEVSISDARASIDRIIPEYITSKEGFPTLPDDQVGLRFPLALTTVSAVPCIKLSSNAYGPTVIAASGQNIDIAAVYVDGVSIPASEVIQGPANTVWVAINWTQVGGSDTRGNPYTGIEFITQNSPAYDGVSIYAGITLRSGNAPTILDVIEKLINDHTAIGSDGYDYVLHARAVAKSGGLLRGEILINGSSENNTATVFSYIDGAICSEFPMLKGIYTGRGYGIIYTDRSASTTSISLVRGQDLLMDRVSAIKETSASDLFNRFILRYNYNTLTDTFQDVIVRDQSNNSLCRISEAKIGPREMPPVDCVLIKDYNSAARVIDWYANHYTLPSYTCTYIAAPRLFFLVEIGDNIMLTDDRLGFDREVATITSMEISAGSLEIEFTVWLQYKNIG